jgi:glycine dehydrogenase
MNLPVLQHPLSYQPQAMARESHRHYIPASDQDVAAMLAETGVPDLAALYNHLPPAIRFGEGGPALPDELEYGALLQRMEAIAAKNRRQHSFLGDGLPQYQVPPVIDAICGIRNLTTAYTPYQPERSQGTLMTHWLYQCAMSQLTGFEAINSSLYDRATAIFEAICTAVRLAKKGGTIALVADGLLPADRAVVATLAAGTDIEVRGFPLDPATGLTSVDGLLQAIAAAGDGLAAVVFPQVNALGLLEDVHALTDAVAASPARSIAVVDPLLLGPDALCPPVNYGQRGVDMIVGEAQHLAIGPNFGGPGLGLFGVRFSDSDRNSIRQTPGRFVGKASDLAGRDCRVMVMSTREQHIRKDKATSNICSNQAFLATLAGAGLLARGDAGLAAAAAAGYDRARVAARRLAVEAGLPLAFPGSPWWNEFVVVLPEPVAGVIADAAEHGVQVGVDVSGRLAGDHRHLLKIALSDIEADIGALVAYFAARYPQAAAGAVPQCVSVPDSLRRRGAGPGIPRIDEPQLLAYYQSLGDLNVSPDDGCYPLGSCTMKYNPFVNDWAASLPGFTAAHPQAPLSDVQGCLEVLFEIQQWFTAITGLAAVTTQPVAGAQGELVGLKLFQAYHRHHGQAQRDVIFIPASAHGTNFATAVMAGYKTRKVDGLTVGIVLLASAPDGTIDRADFEAKLALYRERIAGIMITNPNTCGIFETDFAAIAEAVHAAGGLVYMDGANMNAIAGWCNLGAMGVDAVHNNLHKTWTIPHGGGGPGDAIVAVSQRLADFLPGVQVVRSASGFGVVQPPHSIGSFHRHWGNFAHKVRALTYLYRLGRQGVPRVTALAVLSARYCFAKLGAVYPSLPAAAVNTPRMHEFILTLTEEDFLRIERAGVPKALVIARIGKLFLDFGFHAPTVAWPETFGLMIEPTESYTRAELDRFIEAVAAIRSLLVEHPEVLLTVPHFTPTDRVDDVSANRSLVLAEPLGPSLPAIHPNRLHPKAIAALPVAEIAQRIVAAHQAQSVVP